MLEEDLISEDELNSVEVTHSKNELDLKERELAIQDFKEKELQMQLKLKELELRAKMTPVSKETASSTHKDFDFTCHVKMVPPFREHEVGKFFLHFEKILLQTSVGHQRCKLCWYRVF